MKPQYCKFQNITGHRIYFVFDMFCLSRFILSNPGIMALHVFFLWELNSGILSLLHCTSFTMLTFTESCNISQYQLPDCTLIVPETFPQTCQRKQQISIVGSIKKVCR